MSSAAKILRARPRRAPVTLAVLSGLLALLAFGAFGASSASAATATVTLSLSSSSVTPGAQVTLTAVVSNAAGNPTGTVKFINGTVALTSVALTPVAGSSTDSTASYTTSFANGTYALKAVYYATILAGPSSNVSNLSVAATALHTTSIALSGSPTSVSTGGAVTLTAVVAESDGGTSIPTGAVNFYDNGMLMTSAALDASGTASVTQAGFSSGSNHSFSATYAGDALDAAANSSTLPLLIPVAPSAVQTLITSTATPNPVPPGGTTTLTAHVVQIGTALSPPAGENVAFWNAANNSLITTSPLDANGDATASLGGWLPGEYTIRATYVGDSLNQSSSVNFAVAFATNATVDAPSVTTSYGAAIPALTPTYAGLSGESAPSVTAATCTTPATPASAPGTYAITCSGATDPLYAFLYTSGTLTVTKALLTVTPSNATMTAGTTVPALGATTFGFVNGQTLATSDVTGSAACTTTAGNSSPAGSYPITCTTGSLASADYDFAAAGSGTLTVKPVTPLSVTAPSPTITYGASLPVLTPTYNGFVNGDTASSLTTQPTCTTVATSASPAGTYPVTCSGAVDPSYTTTYVGGTLTIAKASLTVTPVNATMPAGSTVPALSATIAGFANNETLASSGVTGAAACTTTATTSSPAGSYPITCTAGTLAASNYSFSTAGAGTLTVTSTGTATTLIDWVSGPVLSGQPVTLSATLFAGIFPVGGEPITLSLGAQSCTAVTIPFLGTAFCTVTPTGPLGPTTSTATFAGDNRYKASSDSNAALLYAFANTTNQHGGSSPSCGFVVGDRNDSGHITFWGPQWSKQNSFSHGSTPSSFTGWASSASGANWSGGSRDAAPSTLPAYMAVLVANSAGKSGSSFSGNVDHIVIVKVDPGYNGSSSQAGTGTVVATLS